MFKKVGIMVITATILVGAMIFAAGPGGFFGDPSSVVNSLPKQELSTQELQTLNHMLEEEKLARDVYSTLYQIWKFQAFYNIAKSEQAHMAAVKALFDKYGLDSSVYDMKVGEFKTKEMAELYEKLVEQGKKSLVDALKVGATIEDLDIYDLENALKVVDNEDVKLVYQNLIEGSKNHMRAFVNSLERYGETYKAQYISQNKLEEILQAKNSRGRGYGSQGSSAGTGDGTGNGYGRGNEKGDGYGGGKKGNGS